MLLSIRDLVVRIGQIQALRGANLQVAEGTIVALLGANGAGKSTTLKTISGLLRPASGDIFYRGESISKRTPREIVSLGIVQVPEGRRLFPRMTVLENLLVGAYLRSVSPALLAQELEKIFAHFPILGERQRQQAGSMSGGEQQMLAIGRGLMAKPNLMLLDEPSLGLSPLMVEEISRIIGEINRSGVNLLLVEQNAEMALSVAHHGFVLETGRTTLQGPAGDLLASDTIRHAYLGR
ncbi:MAG: ABC transporter ATP-binding protein [Deltaproteobacteria bacterium]|jgi:branched-chain amino acid transport system ATP-binding protein|nr:ABC transporter ATP-binding protein [Deltaproteobacteria bacterium]